MRQDHRLRAMLSSEDTARLDSSVLGWTDLLLISGHSDRHVDHDHAGQCWNRRACSGRVIRSDRWTGDRQLGTAGVLLYRLSVWLFPVMIGWAVTMRWQTTSGVRLFGGAESPAS